MWPPLAATRATPLAFLLTGILAAVLLGTPASGRPAGTCSTDCQSNLAAAGERLIYREGAMYYSSTCGTTGTALSMCTHIHFTGSKQVASCSGVAKCFAQIKLHKDAVESFWLLSHECGYPTTTPIGSTDTVQCAPGTCTDCFNTSSNPRLIKSGRQGLYHPLTCPAAALGALPGCSQFQYTGTRVARNCGDGFSKCFAQVTLPQSPGSSMWLFSHECGKGKEDSVIVEPTNEQCAAVTTACDCSSISAGGERIIRSSQRGIYYRSTCGVTSAGELSPCAIFWWTGVREAHQCGSVKRCYVEMKLSKGDASSYWLLSHSCSSSGQTETVIGLLGIANCPTPKTCTGCDLQCQTCNPATGACDNRPGSPSCTSVAGGTCKNGKCALPSSASCPTCVSGAAGEKLVPSVFGARYYPRQCATGSDDHAGTISECTHVWYTGVHQAVACFYADLCYAEVQLTREGPSYWVLDHVCGQSAAPPLAELSHPQCGGDPTSCDDCQPSDEGERLIYKEEGARYYETLVYAGTNSMARILSKCSHFYYTGIKTAVNVGGTGKCYAHMQLVKGGTTHFLFSHNCGQASTSPIGNLSNIHCAGPQSGIMAWGRGYVGNGNGMGSAIPVKVTTDQAFVQLFSCGEAMLGMRADGAVFSWGSSSMYMDRFDGVPRELPGALRFSQISAGFSHICGLLLSGETYCWGEGYNARTPAPFAASAGRKFVSIASGYNTACGIDASASAWCWGFYTAWIAKGQMGNGQLDASATPVAVLGGLKFLELAGGWNFMCGRTKDLEIWCWGSGQFGQCGNGVLGSSSIKHTMPVRVLGGHSWTSLTVSQSGSHACGLVGSKAFCWGYGASGQLGNGQQADSAVPVEVRGGISWLRLTAASSYTCGLSTTGLAYCWGNNEYAYLGNGGTAPSSTPVAVSGGHTFTSLTSSSSFSSGILGKPPVMTTHTDCLDSLKGDRLIAADRTGNTYASFCAASVATAYLPCTRLFYTGRKQAVDCSGVVKCYAQVQATEGAASQWMLSHVAGESETSGTSIVKTDYTKCGNPGVETSNCLPACQSDLTATGPRVILSSKTGSYFESSGCAATPGGTLDPCTRFHFTGTKKAINCGTGGGTRCYAQIKMRESDSAAIWLLSHDCNGGSTVIGDADNERCGGVRVSCGDCQPGLAGLKRIKSTQTGSYFRPGQCGISPLDSLQACSTFYFTGDKQAMSCSGKVKCYAQIKLSQESSDSWWLYSHECGKGETESVIVPQNNPDCGGVAASCTDCKAGDAGLRLIKSSQQGSLFRPALSGPAQCGEAGDGFLSSCSSFYFTGEKTAVDCSGKLKCYARVKLSQGATDSWWLFSHDCGSEQASIIAKPGTDCARTCIGCNQDCQFCDTTTGVCMNVAANPVCPGGKCSSGKCVPSVKPCPTCNGCQTCRASTGTCVPNTAKDGSSCGTGGALVCKNGACQDAGCRKLVGFSFHSRKEVKGGNLVSGAGRCTVKGAACDRSWLALQCASIPDCRGFSTDGYLKSTATVMAAKPSLPVCNGVYLRTTSARAPVDWSLQLFRPSYQYTPVDSVTYLEVKGRLEVWRSGGWNTVCRAGFGNFWQPSTNALVACRSLGYTSPKPARVPQDVAAPAGGNTAHEYACSSASGFTLQGCALKGITCRHAEDVWLACRIPIPADTQTPLQTCSGINFGFPFPESTCLATESCCIRLGTPAGGATPTCCQLGQCANKCEVGCGVALTETLTNGVFEGLVKAAGACTNGGNPTTCATNTPAGLSAVALSHLFATMTSGEYGRQAPTSASPCLLISKATTNKVSAFGKSWMTRGIIGECNLDTTYTFISRNVHNILGTTRAKGFGVVLHSQTDVFVIIRGTNVADDWWAANLKLASVRGSPWLPGNLHQGFLERARGMYATLIKALEALPPPTSPYRVWFLGHSMGGVVAEICAYALTKDITWNRLPALTIAGIYTWGSPQPGNAVFQQAYDKMLNNITLHFVHLNDVVSNVPGNFLGFRHVGRHWQLLSALNANMYPQEGPLYFGDYTCTEVVKKQEANPATCRPKWKMLQRHSIGSYAAAMRDVILNAAWNPKSSDFVAWNQARCLFQHYAPQV